MNRREFFSKARCAAVGLPALAVLGAAKPELIPWVAAEENSGPPTLRVEHARVYGATMKIEASNWEGGPNSRWYTMEWKR